MRFIYRYSEKKRLADLIILVFTIFFILIGLITMYGRNPHETQNPYNFQIVLSDENNRIMRYNIAVAMEAENLSADLPITVYADARWIDDEESRIFYKPEQMYLIFVGSNQIPPSYTGLAYGQYFGQIVLNKQAGGIYYKGNGTITFNAGGTFPVFLSSAATSITEPLKEEELPHYKLPIGSEEETRALQSYENERANMGLTFAIIGLSIAALRPVAQEIVDDWF